MEKIIASDNYKSSIEIKFYSLCRNFNNFNDISNEDIKFANEVADSIRNKYNNYSRDSIYYRYLSYIWENFYNYEKKICFHLY